jgi:hypothetical protein
MHNLILLLQHSHRADVDTLTEEGKKLHPSAASKYVKCSQECVARLYEKVVDIEKSQQVGRAPAYHSSGVISRP